LHLLIIVSSLPANHNARALFDFAIGVPMQNLGS
jgi:hypothetical protein